MDRKKSLSFVTDEIIKSLKYFEEVFLNDKKSRNTIEAVVAYLKKTSNDNMLTAQSAILLVIGLAAWLITWSATQSVACSAACSVAYPVARLESMTKTLKHENEILKKEI